MFWLSQNRFCNLCIKGNVQIHLILFLHFGTRNTCKPYPINWIKIILFPTIFTGNLKKKVIWKLSSEACVKVQKPWFLLSCLFHSLCQTCLSNIFHCNNLDLVSRELEGKRIDARTVLKRNKVTFNPKGQLLSHTWHSLQYLSCSEVHSWAGTLPPQPHGVIPLHKVWEIQANSAYFGMLGSWGYLMIIANDLSSCFSCPSERTFTLDLGLLCSSALTGGAEGVKIHRPLLLLVQLLLPG